MNNKVVDAAIAAMNEQNQKNAEGRAAVVINEVKQLRCANKGSTESIAKLQAKLAELQQPCISAECILGSPLPPEESQNENQKTIARSITAMVKAKQGSVEVECKALADRIAAEQAQVKSNEAAVAKLLEKLAAITPEIVTSSEITG